MSLRATTGIAALGSLTALTALSVLAAGPASPALAEPTPSAPPAWPRPGEGANPGTSRPLNFQPPGTLQEVRKPYVAISTNTERGGNSFSLSTDVLFKTGSAELSGAAQANIQAVADQLKKSGVSGGVRVVGHTDNVGRPSGNQTLSEERARGVRDALGPLLPNTGIKLSAEGKGETQPIATNSTVAGKAKNRRVAVVYRPSAGSSATAGTTDISVSSTDLAPPAAAPVPEVPNPIASVQRTVRNKWTVRLDITEVAGAGKYIKIGYMSRMINQPENDNIYYGSLFSGDSLNNDDDRALLIDKAGGEELHPLITGKARTLRDAPGDDYLGQPQYGWHYFPRPSKTGGALSFYVPALGTIDGLKIRA